jgi:phosphatidylinositol-3-phosphatase
MILVDSNQGAPQLLAVGRASASAMPRDPGRASRFVRMTLLPFAVAVVVVLVTPTLSLGTTTSSPASPSASISNGAVASGFPTPIRHVVVLFFENNNRSVALAKGAYFRHLADTYAQDSHYYAVCHPSAPNYLAATSGARLQCGSDAYHTYGITNIATLLKNASITSWSGFMQSMPKPCDTVNSGLYAVRHNPFVYYTNVLDNSTYCNAHDQSLTAWTADVRAGTIPAYSFIAPNLDNDAHDTNISYASHWLKGFLSPLLNDSWFSSTVFFVTFDEAYGTGRDTGYNGTAGGNVYFAAVSPYAVPGLDDTTNASDYNLLSTVEWLLGLGSTGHNDGTSKFSAMKSLFAFA